MNPADLKKQIETWINSEGYPLEYKAYSALKSQIPSTDLGSYIESSDGVYREIDVCAQQSHVDLETHRTFLARIICECKFSKKNPWVLLYGVPGSRMSVVEWTHTPRSKLLHSFPTGMSKYLYGELQDISFFSEGGDLAHNLVQANMKKESGRDHAYDSLRKITHSAWDVIERMEAAIGTELYVFVFPCLVVDTPLFAAVWDARSSKICVREISYGRMCWHGCRSGTNVDVVHAKALDEYAAVVGRSMMATMRFLRTLVEHGPDVQIPDSNS